MCLHRSYIVTESEQVFACSDNDHHTQIVRQHCLDDKKKWPGIKEPVFIEYNPVEDLLHLNKWELSFDNTTHKPPTWWTKGHQSRVMDTLEKDHAKYTALDSTYIFPGDLDLSLLQCLGRPRMTVIANAILIGHKVHCIIPPECTLISLQGPIVLSQGTRIYENCSFFAPQSDVYYDGPKSKLGSNVFDRRTIKSPSRYRYDSYEALNDYKQYIPQMSPNIFSFKP